MISKMDNNAMIILMPITRKVTPNWLIGVLPLKVHVLN